MISSLVVGVIAFSTATGFKWLTSLTTSGAVVNWPGARTTSEMTNAYAIAAAQAATMINRVSVLLIAVALSTLGGKRHETDK
jgi:hypothetical protein